MKGPILRAPVLAFAALPALLPIAGLLLALAGGGTDVAAGVSDLLRSRAALGLLAGTAAVSAAAALLASSVGLFLGLLTARTDLPGGRALPFVILAPQVLPSYLLSLGALDVLGYSTLHASPVALVCLLAILHLPIPMWAVVAAIRTTPASVEESAALLLPPKTALGRVVLPRVLPDLAAAAALVFLLSIGEFAIPALLGDRTYALEIALAFGASYDVARATAYAAPLLAISIALIAACDFGLGGRSAVLAGGRPARPPVPARLGRWRIPAAAVAWGFALAILAPFFALVSRADGPTLLAQASASAPSIGRSFVVGTAAVALSLACAWIIGARSRRLSLLVIGLVGVPGAVVGIGVLHLALITGSSSAGLLLAHVSRILPIALLLARAHLARIPPSLADAAELHALPRFLALVRVRLPLAAPALATAGAVAFLLSLREIDASTLVYPPGGETFPVRLYAILANAPESLVASLAALLVGVTALAAGSLLGARLGWRRLAG